MKNRLYFLLAVLAAALCASSCVGRTAPPTSQTTREPAASRVSIEDLPELARKPVPEGFAVKVPAMVVLPKQKKRALPVYPPNLVGARIQCDLQLLAHVLTDGSVKVIQIEWLADPGEEHQAAFENALCVAVGTWEYKPALRIVPTKMPDDSTEMVPHPIPKAIRLRVGFSVIDGQGTVSVRKGLHGGSADR